MYRIIALLLSITSLASQAQTLQQTAGIYYAYPTPQGTLTPAPEGYTPAYISHYGRHGSRWITDDYRYLDVINAFADTTRLTPLGRDVYGRLQVVCADAIGRSGSLSPLGAKQHHDIAARMISHYPEVFAEEAQVDAVSSTSLRCAMSMSFFTEALKEVNPRLHVSRTAYDKDMSYIAHTTPAGKAFSADTAYWRKDYWDYVAQTVHPERLIQSLFIDPDMLTPEQQLKLGTGLYWIASDMQNVDLDLDFYDIFTYDELRSYWSCVNARMYMCNGAAPEANGVMMHCADNLLRDFITKADAALAGNSTSANLRFGHDTHLLRLLALIGVEGATGQETDMAKFSDVWRDYSLSPMAANLQMIFFRNDGGDTLVKVLLNEKEVTLPLESDLIPYYRWDELRAYLLGCLSEMECCAK